MILRYEGPQQKFTRHGRTWRKGVEHDVDVSEREARWMLRHGFVSVPREPVPVSEPVQERLDAMRDKVESSQDLRADRVRRGRG